MLKASMKYTLKDVEKYCQKIRNSNGIFGFYILLFILYTAAFIFFILENTPKYALVILGCVQVFIVCVFVFMFFTAKKLPEKEYNKLQKKYGGETVSFDFDYDKFTVKTQKLKDNSYDAIQYKTLEYAVSTDEYFYFIRKDQDDIFLKKSAFTDGTAKDLEDILMDRLEDKFIIKYSRELDY